MLCNLKSSWSRSYERERERSYICYMTFHNQTQDQKDSEKNRTLYMYIYCTRQSSDLLAVNNSFL